MSPLQIPTSIPNNKRKLLEQLVTELSQVAGMAAIVLGGSYARGMAHSGSDLDIGLYYREDEPFPIDGIRRIATAFSVDGEPTVTDFYGWGRWVNGGAWIQTEAGKVDFLYRKVEQVQQTIADAQQGIIERDYDQQPTHGFYSIIYLAESEICVPLYDPNHMIAHLKEQVALYPPKLKQHIMDGHLWSAEFTLIHAHGFAEKGDVYNTVGCLTRVVGYLTQVLFALNETYFLTDKLVIETIGQFPIIPARYVQQLATILSNPGSDSRQLQDSVRAIEALWQQVTLCVKTP